MYHFTNKVISGLIVSSTIAKMGTEHFKKYIEPGVSPSNQNTLNVYISGNFLVEVGNFSQIMSSGNTSLDLTIPEYPVNSLCKESVLSNWGHRICISSKNLWSKELIVLNNNETYITNTQGLLLILTGQLQINNSILNSISYRHINQNTTLICTSSNSKLIFCKAIQ